MSALGKLAGQTAIYGLSSVIGRILNFLLIPIYARLFLPEEAAVFVEIYAYVAFFIVILTYGMETAFFRYSETAQNKNSVYSTTFVAILSTSVLFIVGMLFFAQNIANHLRYPEHPEYIIYFIFIVSIDAINSIPFAKLRAEHKATRFAVIKIVNIAVNIGSNLVLLLLFPYLYNTIENSSFVQIVSLITNGTPQVGHIFLSNLIASVVTCFLLIPEIRKTRFDIDLNLLKTMLKYAFPLLIFGLAGIVNETIDRVLLKYLLPPDEAMYSLGIYGMCYKISIFISIFIQAFRYAAEPFFFSQYKEHNAKEMYAKVMHYFIIICLFMFLGIMLYMDIVKHFVAESYFSGLHIVPVLLFANIFLGVFYNLSVWYKITGHTRFGAYISLAGAGITIILNIILIPIMGYVGAAWATFACYFCMMLLSYLISRKYYPIPYKMPIILFYTIVTLIIYFFTELVQIEHQSLKMIVHSLLLFLFVAVVVVREVELSRLLKNKISQIFSNMK